jgi:hypothetical protein
MQSLGITNLKFVACCGNEETVTTSTLKMPLSEVIDSPTIPAPIQQQILPDESLSVFDFLQFKVPLGIKATRFTHLQDYLSNDPSTPIDIEAIRSLPSPPSAVI